MRSRTAGVNAARTHARRDRARRLLPHFGLRLFARRVHGHRWQGLRAVLRQGRCDFERDHDRRAEATYKQGFFPDRRESAAGKSRMILGHSSAFTIGEHEFSPELAHLFFDSQLMESVFGSLLRTMWYFCRVLLGFILITKSMLLYWLRSKQNGSQVITGELVRRTECCALRLVHCPAERRFVVVDCIAHVRCSPGLLLIDRHGRAYAGRRPALAALFHPRRDPRNGWRFRSQRRQGDVGRARVGDEMREAPALVVR